MIDAVKYAIGIDTNTLWMTMVTILIAICPFLKKHIRSFPTNKMLKSNLKVESESFYVRIMGCAFVVTILITLCYSLLKLVTQSNCIIFLHLFLVDVMMIIIINKSDFVKIRCLSRHRIYLLILIDLPIFIIPARFCMILFEIKDSIVILAIFFFLVIMCEIIGLIIFSSRYTKYEHSLLTINLYNMEKICNVDVTKIREAKKWVVISRDDKEMLIQYCDIKSIEFYGETKYVLNETFPNKCKLNTFFI